MSEKCVGCDNEVDYQKVIDYSKDKYGKVFCYECQKEEKANNKIDESTKKTGEAIKKTQQAVNNVVKNPETAEEGYIMLQGKKYITHKGLLKKAHKIGLKSIMTEIIDFERNIFKSTVIMNDDSIFTGHGDADTQNVNSMIDKHKIRMAETRATNRALRLATNTGECSSEELGGDDASKDKK